MQRPAAIRRIKRQRHGEPLVQRPPKKHQALSGCPDLAVVAAGDEHKVSQVLANLLKPDDYTNGEHAIRKREREICTYQDPVFEQMTKELQSRQSTIEPIGIRAIVVNWLCDLSLDLDDTTGLIVGGVNNFTGTIVSQHADELQCLTVLAVSYFDAFFDGSTGDSLLPIDDDHRDNAQISAAVCFIAACKFSNLTDDDARQLQKNIVPFLQSCVPSIPLGKLERIVFKMEHILWQDVLRWRGWRPTAATWLLRAADQFAQSDYRRLVHTLPVLLLDTWLSRAIWPSDLAFCIIMASSVSYPPGMNALALRRYFRGSTQEIQDRGDPVGMRQIIDYVFRIRDILLGVVLPEEQLNELPAGLQWSKKTVTLARHSWRGMVLACDPSLGLLFRESPPVLGQSS